MSLRDSDYDLTRIIAKPLYFGTFVNVIVPGILMLLCFYIEKNRGWAPLVDLYYLDTIRGVIAVAALVHLGLVIWWRTKLYASPMIRRKETFEQDFAAEYFRRTKPLFFAIASLALYGIFYFLVTGEFDNFFLGLFIYCFLVFQFVRPRYGLVQKLIERQEKLVAQGQLQA
jgi:hypothetical protein